MWWNILNQSTQPRFARRWVSLYSASSKKRPQKGPENGPERGKMSIEWPPWALSWRRPSSWPLPPWGTTPPPPPLPRQGAPGLLFSYAVTFDSSNFYTWIYFKFKLCQSTPNSAYMDFGYMVFWWFFGYMVFWKTFSLINISLLWTFRLFGLF